MQKSSDLAHVHGLLPGTASCVCFSPFISFTILQVMALRPRFSIAAQKARAEKGQGQYTGNAQDVEDDEESVKGMARLFAELGEAYTALIATGAKAACYATQMHKECHKYHCVDLRQSLKALLVRAILSVN